MQHSTAEVIFVNVFYAYCFRSSVDLSWSLETFSWVTPS